MRQQISNLYHCLKASEGGTSISFNLFHLKNAGIKAKYERSGSYYIGHYCLEVFGNKRIQERASNILFGGNHETANHTNF